MKADLFIHYRSNGTEELIEGNKIAYVLYRVNLAKGTRPMTIKQCGAVAKRMTQSKEITTFCGSKFQYIGQ